MPVAATAIRLTLARAPAAQFADGRRLAIAPVDALLLAWLAIEGPTARQRMATLLWPASEPKAAANTLRQRLFKLRRQLGDVVSAEGVLALDDALSHDLAQADELLAEVDLALGDELAAWLRHQREARAQRRCQALAERADAAERAGAWPAALALARELLAAMPLSEEAHRRVIRLHYLAGDTAAAALAFDACERMLKHEVGVRPSRETLALLQALDTGTLAPALPAVVAARAPAAVLRPPRLVGRQPQWQALAEAMDGPRVALVTGEGGMGKTRLCGDFARAQGFAVFAGARPGDEPIAYASFSRLLRALPPASWERLGAPARAELARLLPELGPAPPPLDDGNKVRLLNAAASLFGPGAPGAGGVLFDDLHAADDASVELLQYVVSMSPGRWLLAARASELGPAARRWFDPGADESGVPAVALPALTVAQVAELVDTLAIDGLDGAAVAPALLARSGGNPQVLLEIVKAGHAQGDAAGLPAVAGLYRLVAGRISRLSPQAVQLARCAAIATPDFSIDLAAHVLGLRTLDLADPWAELEQAQVLVDGAFAHDLIYEAALHSVPEAVARRLHAEIAAFLAGQDGEPARLAHHWRRAGRWRDAGQACMAAADRARDAARAAQHLALLADAADCFERADLPDERFAALLRRAALMSELMLGPQALEAIEAAQALARTPLQRLELLMVRCEHANLAADLDAAIAHAAVGTRLAAELGREDLELRLACAGASALADARRGAEAVALLQPYADMARRQASHELHWNYWQSLALCLDYAGRLRDAGPAWDESRAVAMAAQRRDLAWQSMANAAATLSKLGQVRRAVALYEHADRLALDVQHPASRLQAMRSTRAHRLRDIGRYAEALPMLEQALAEFTERAMPFESALAEHRLAQLHQQLGQPARARHCLAAERTGLPRWTQMVRAVHAADVAHDLGHDALPAMREAMAIIADPDDIYHRVASLFATRLVPPDEGEALATGLADWARARERLGLALAAHVRAAGCALAQGAPGRALPHVQAALLLAAEHQPDSFYLPELWWVACRVHAALGDAVGALAHQRAGRAWIDETAQVPAPFVDSFRQRNPVNRGLLGPLPTGPG